jgi:hypothetical protein
MGATLLVVFKIGHCPNQNQPLETSKSASTERGARFAEGGGRFTGMPRMTRRLSYPSLKFARCAGPCGCAIPPSGERALIWKPRPYLSYCIISSTYKSKWKIFQPYFIGEFRRPCPTFCNLKEIFSAMAAGTRQGVRGRICAFGITRIVQAFSAARSALACGIAACILGRRGGPACPPSPLPGTEPRSGNPQLLGNLAQRPAAARQQPHRLSLEFIRN